MLLENSMALRSFLRHRSRPVSLPSLWIIVLLQASLHLALLPFGGYIDDTTLLRTWATTLFSHPVSQFYSRQPEADHLPGDLWILKLEAWLYHLASGNAPSNAGFLYALKLGPAIADVGIAMTLYFIAREISGQAAGRRAALLFALNPAPLFLSMVWGVADAVSMLFAGLALLLMMKRCVWAALPVLAYACLIKPQLAVLAPIFLIFGAREAWHGVSPTRFIRPAAQIVAGGLAALAVVLAVILPFDVGFPFFSRHWSLLERVRYSAGAYDKVTLNALNLWALGTSSSSRFPSFSGISDSAAIFPGVTFQRMGIAYAAIACLYLALPLIKRGGTDRLLFTGMATLFACFMLLTRIHERYFFPAVALMAAVAALRSRWIWLYVAMTSVYFANIVMVYIWIRPANQTMSPTGSLLPRPSNVSTLEVRALVAVNVAVLICLIGGAMRDRRAAASNQTPFELVESSERLVPA
jgi:hypothetical protein